METAGRCLLKPHSHRLRDQSASSWKHGYYGKVFCDQLVSGCGKLWLFISRLPQSPELCMEDAGLSANTDEAVVKMWKEHDKKSKCLPSK